MNENGRNIIIYRKMYVSAANVKFVAIHRRLNVQITTWRTHLVAAAVRLSRNASTGENRGSPRASVRRFREEYTQANDSRLPARSQRVSL